MTAGRLFRAIGLMSGTSMDGIDSAVVETDGHTRLTLGPHASTFYPPGLRHRLLSALNELRREMDRDPIPFEQARRRVSHGAGALVRLGFPEVVDSAFETLRQRFLDIYSRRLYVGSSVYEGISESLARLESIGIPWGVVTNKPAWLTEPLLEQFELRQRASVVVSGDSLPERKPHPAPLLHAAGQLGIAQTVAGNRMAGHSASDVQPPRVSHTVSMREHSAGENWL
jgi:phosphoglycolate phosphatase-like HAD superfamily hydrolase